VLAAVSRRNDAVKGTDADASSFVGNHCQVRFPGMKHSQQDRDAIAVAGRLCLTALQLIRTSAYLGRPVSAPEDFEGDTLEWIRLLADACDGLSMVQSTEEPAEVLAYRTSVWTPVQSAWAAAALAPRPDAAE